MDHAEVRSRLEESLFLRGGVAALATSDDRDDAAVLEHLAGCELCAHEYHALDATSEALAEAAPEVMTPPDGARDRLMRQIAATPRRAQATRPAAATPALHAAPPTQLAMPHTGGGDGTGLAASNDGGTVARGTTTWRPPVAGTPEPATAARQRRDPTASPMREPGREPGRRANHVGFLPRLTQGRAMLGLAAAAALAFFAAGVLTLAGFVGERDRSADDARRLAALTRQTDILLRQPDHREAVLSNSARDRAGTVLLSAAGDRLVVITDALEYGNGAYYECFIERAGKRIPMGYMEFAQGLAFWAGPIRGVEDPGRPGDRFVVVDANRADRAVLTGTFRG